MSLTELQPVLQNLSTTDKLHLVQWLISQVVSESSRHLTTTITDPKEDPLWDIVGMAAGDAASVARHHDTYLYGTPPL